MNLYKRKQTEISSTVFFRAFNNKLDIDESRNCEGLLTEFECSQALYEMKNNKSPGSDGLSVEFYKIFWKYIKQHYINSINYSFAQGELTTLQKQGIITLLPKTGKE